MAQKWAIVDKGRFDTTKQVCGPDIIEPSNDQVYDPDKTEPKQPQKVVNVSPTVLQGQIHTYNDQMCNPDKREPQPGAWHRQKYAT